MVTNGLSESIIGRAAKSGIISLDAVNIRDYSTDKHNKVDDYPYGGGAGMLMQAAPVYDAWKDVSKGRAGVRTIYVTPQGATFTQEMAREFAKEDELIFLCGHYEGIDERVLEEIVTDYVSIGDYVLTGGELAAMVMIDAISRMVPGVLTNDMSGITESFEGNLLEYPQYSRPEEWHGKRVPEVLLSGNRKEISAYRLQESIKRTKERRPDIYEKYEVLDSLRERLMKRKILHTDMIELIRRGRAILIYQDEYEILLMEKITGIYFHTCDNMPEGKSDFPGIDMIAESRARQRHPATLLVFHQDETAIAAERKLNAEILTKCTQAVYTRREKVPVRGMYTTVEDDGIRPYIRQLTEEYTDFVVDNYSMAYDPEQIRKNIISGNVFGAFVDGEIAGFVGLHEEGSAGMLEVIPKYKGRGIGKALEAFIINQCLEWGFVPYGQIVCGNTVSENLQGTMGLAISEPTVYWAQIKSACNLSDT
jgi:tRNA (guanine37-N1)-methyltransferase